MIKIDKKITVTIDGYHVEVLYRVCELARRYIRNNNHFKEGSGSGSAVDEYSPRQCQEIEEMMTKIFDN